jgi:uncharacterized protein YndB with AHSA1/START domain
MRRCSILTRSLVGAHRTTWSVSFTISIRARAARTASPLRYKDPHRVGKSSGHTDTYHGRFLRIVPDEEVVETMQFEADDPALRGPMTLTTTLNDVDEGTEVVMRHGGIPDAVPAADNELGTRMALANLARIVERPANT